MIVDFEPLSKCVDHGLRGNHHGYGVVTLNSKNYRLHRVVYCRVNSIKIEEIDGKVIRHTCDNPRCINPDHLVLGSHADNMNDMALRRRGNNLKLTIDNVKEIRATCVPNKRGVNDDKNKFSFSALARKFGVNLTSIKKVFNGKTHKNF